MKLKKYVHQSCGGEVDIDIALCKKCGKKPEGNEIRMEKIKNSAPPKEDVVVPVLAKTPTVTAVAAVTVITPAPAVVPKHRTTTRRVVVQPPPKFRPKDLLGIQLRPETANSRPRVYHFGPRKTVHFGPAPTSSR